MLTACIDRATAVIERLTLLLCNARLLSRVAQPFAAALPTPPASPQCYCHCYNRTVITGRSAWLCFLAPHSCNVAFNKSGSSRTPRTTTAMNCSSLMQASHSTGLKSSHAAPRRQQCLCRAHSHQFVRSSTPPTCRAWGSAKAAAAAAALAALVLPGAAHAADLQRHHLCPAPPAAVEQQQQQQQSQARPGQQRLSSIGDLAGLFDPTSEVDPFTINGTNFKKYQIEKMEGEKVVSRTRGFTVDSCVSAIAASEETPEINGMSTRDKVQVGEGLLCKRAVGPDLKQACKASCTSACTSALDRYEERLFAQSGYRLEPKDRERVLRNCRHSCAYECTKSGTAHDFVVTYRR